MQPKMQHYVDKINHLIQQVQQTSNFLELETIDLPFQIVETGVSLWKTIFPIETLQQLAEQDEDTLNAWAIVLSRTLKTQLEVINYWLPELAILPIPHKLNQRLSDCIRDINQIAQDKYQLLQTSSTLLSQEQQLRQEKAELDHLKEKVAELQQIHRELQATDLESLKKSISSLEAAFTPEKQVLRSLQQEKANLESQIVALQQQQDILKTETLDLQSQQNYLEASTVSTAQNLITLTQCQQLELTTALTTALTELDKQKDNYQRTYEQLEKAIQNSSQYQSETQSIQTHLSTHYQSDNMLKELLPINHQKVDTLVQTIKQNLAELDQEIATARSKHERLQQKTILTF